MASIAELRARLRNVEGEKEDPALSVVHTWAEEPDDPPEPNSSSWSANAGPGSLTDPQYDWRRGTKKGNESRERFSSYIADAIRSGRISSVEI